MTKSISKAHKGFGVTSIESKTLNKELALPLGLKLSPFARPRRQEMLNEALAWPKGKSQTNRKITKVYRSSDYVIAVGKPGKEAAPDFKRRHYTTGEVVNNPNDMNPFVMKKGKKIGDDLTFEALFEQIEHLMHADMLGLELLGTLIFRLAFMLDHTEDAKGHWRYIPPPKALEVLLKRIPVIGDTPSDVFLYFLDVLALNEDVKMHTLGHENARHDYGRVNTLLTFAHLIAVLLNRRSLAKFSLAFAYPPFNQSPLPKSKGLFESFPLLSPDF